MWIKFFISATPKIPINFYLMETKSLQINSKSVIEIFRRFRLWGLLCHAIIKFCKCYQGLLRHTISCVVLGRTIDCYQSAFVSQMPRMFTTSHLQLPITIVTTKFLSLFIDCNHFCNTKRTGWHYAKKILMIVYDR